MPTVKIYSTPTCPYCKMAKDYLKAKGVKLEEIDISADPARADEIFKRSGQTGVPVLDIDGEIIVGFDRQKINKALGLV
ncbi:MAG: glutaredoxin family protein [Candidatus Saganbacteria bacterium]|nr:glutaredoxin family protein [Candidatus Saganbacteria bacterium]